MRKSTTTMLKNLHLEYLESKKEAGGSFDEWLDWLKIHKDKLIYEELIRKACRYQWGSKPKLIRLNGEKIFEFFTVRDYSRLYSSLEEIDWAGADIAIYRQVVCRYATLEQGFQDLEEKRKNLKRVQGAVEKWEETLKKLLRKAEGKMHVRISELYSAKTK